MILAASVFEILRGKSDKQTNKQTPVKIYPPPPLPSACVTSKLTRLLGLLYSGKKNCIYCCL